MSLRERTLRSDHPAVHSLVRMAAYHLGEMPSDADAGLPWRVDLLHGGAP